MSRVVVFVALRQLWDRKLLNGIAVVGVALGVLTLVGIRGILAGFQRKFIDNIIKVSPHVVLLDDRLLTDPPLLANGRDGPVLAAVAHERPRDRQLRVQRPREVERALEQIDGVTAASGSLVGSVVLSLGAAQTPVDLRGIEPEQQEEVTPIAQYVKSGSFEALGITSDGILLGEGVASDIGAKVGDVLSAGAATGKPLTLEVVGIYASDIPPIDNSRVYVSLRNAQALLGKPDVVGRIEMRLSDPDRADEVATRVERLFGYDAVSWRETNANFLALFKQQDMITGFVVAAILAVGGFGILAIQIMIVLQKTRDIAILRSVGFRRRDILTTFLMQGMIIALCGAVVGNVGGHYLLAALSRLRTPQEGLVKSEYFLVYDDPKYYLYGLGFALVVGIVASLIPALRAAQVEPVDVLRGQIG